MYCYTMFVIFCLCNFANTAVIPDEKEAAILSYEYKNFGNGNYVFSYVTSNGITRNETGQLVDAGQDKKYIAVQGYYSYTDPGGYSRRFQYTADENGYHVNFMERPKLRIIGDEPILTEYAGPIAPQLASLIGK